MEIHGANIHSKVAKEVERILKSKRFDSIDAELVARKTFEALRQFEIETEPIDFMCLEKTPGVITIDPSNLYTFIAMSGFDMPTIYDLPKYGTYNGKVASYRFEIDKEGELKKQIIFQPAVKYIEVQITLQP